MRELSRFCFSKNLTKVFLVFGIVAGALCVYMVLGLKGLETHHIARSSPWRPVPDPDVQLYTDTLTTELRFQLNSSFKIPWHKNKPLDSIVSRRWFQELKLFLSNSTPNYPIVLVSGDNNYKKPLISWLIAATVKQEPPIRNILVITYVQSFCYFLNSKNYSCKCLVIPPETLTAESMYRHESSLENFYKLLIARVFVLRLISYWGFDVVNFDSDAIILKNPIPLFYSKEYAANDIVGTFGGKLPLPLYEKWGVVSCMGCIFIRSSKRTETFWNTFQKIDVYDDQVKFNYGLEKAGVQWTNKNVNVTNSKDPLSVQWEGQTSDGLNITLLPQRMACREYGCVPEVRNSCYVWHRGLNYEHKGSSSKQDSLQNKVWFYEESHR